MPKKCGLIALAGRPNAGKSTFLNHVLGEKVSIVSDKPQTTRKKILGVYHADNLQIGFLDLPGIHKPKFRMNRMMMRAVHQGLNDGDVIFHFIDLSVTTGSGDRYVSEALKEKETPLILVLNKIDLVNRNKMIEKVANLYEQFSPVEVVPISSKTGENIESLLEVGASFLPAGKFLFNEDQLTDQTLRFMSAETIREKILHNTKDELPHAVAVTIEEFVEAEEGTYISAILWAERPTQRAILLGAGGQMISKIRLGARRSLTDLLDRPVDLELFVKVENKWRDSQRLLSNTDLGLISN